MDALRLFLLLATHGQRRNGNRSRFAMMPAKSGNLFGSPAPPAPPPRTEPVERGSAFFASGPTGDYSYISREEGSRAAPGSEPTLLVRREPTPDIYGSWFHDADRVRIRRLLERMQTQQLVRILNAEKSQPGQLSGVALSELSRELCDRGHPLGREYACGG